MGRIGGNSSGPGGPFGSTGLDWEGNRGDGNFGGADDAIGRDSINQKANRGGLKRDIGIGKQKTVLDRPVIASKARAKASCSDEYESGNWYGGPASRQEK